MQKYIDDENLVAQMGEKARTGIRELNNEQRYYDTLMGIYIEVINKNKK
jgi:hypothetical protein